MSEPAILSLGDTGSDPAGNPPAGYIYWYIKSGLSYTKNSSGTVSTAAGVSSLTGDVTGTGPGATATTIANNAVTNAKAAQMANGTIKGRTTAGTGNSEDLTGTQATALLNAVVGDSGSGGTKGLVPAPSAGDAAANKFLKADGTFAVVTAGITALTGDVTASGSGSVAATVALVGGSTAANVHTAELLANAATALNTSSAIMKRDGSGQVAATTFTGNLTGNASGTAASFTGALTGDVTSSAMATTIAANAVTNAKAAQMATNTIKGNNTGSTANASDLTVAQVLALLVVNTTAQDISMILAFNSGMSVN